MAFNNHEEQMPVVRQLKDFDQNSGNALERLIFNFRHYVLWICLALTAVFVFQSSKLVLNSSFEKILPTSHSYIQNYLSNKTDLRSLGNLIRISVENPNGDILDAEYIKTLREINDDLFLMPGVDRAWLKSLWTPFVRWTEVTEEGFRGAPVMPGQYDGSDEKKAQLKINILRAGIVGSLVSHDFKSSVIVVPLLDKNENGEPLDYGALSRNIENNIRTKYGAGPQPKVAIHVIGFAKLSGDLIEGVSHVMTFFGYAVLIAAILIYVHTRCARSTGLLLLCSIVAVVWQLGLIVTLGFALDPYSVLVPFLVFAIGVSHGAQKMNGIMQDVSLGTHKYVASRYTFRRLFLAGLTALLADAVAFAVLILIDIPVIKELAVIASLGVAILIFTNLILLPVLLSYVGVSTRENAEISTIQFPKLAAMMVSFTERRWATGLVAISVVATMFAFSISQKLRIGDIDPGAPELHVNSRYNKDVAFFNANYGLSTDQFAVIVKTPPGGCEKYQTLIEIDRLSWMLQQLPSVQAVQSLPDIVRNSTAGSNEGNPKWMSINRSQEVINSATRGANVSNPELMNNDCAVTPVIANLKDHKAETLDEVLSAVERFAKEHDTDELKFLPVAGSAGIEAVTNIVVEKANRQMLICVYAAVILLCYVTFRNWRAVVVAVVPLAVTSVFCEALMVFLGMGVKVATLPVVALGVGIGVDYALYILSIQLAEQRAGASLKDAYLHALKFTGKVVALVGITLAAGVVTWAYSPIKFQSDMGVLLAFMFVWNMLGALFLTPALSHFMLSDVGKTQKN
jgi:predicted RND superfamily exporter protein